MALQPDDLFERPVIILTGLGHPTAISSVMEAFMFLTDWSGTPRDASHGFALKACRAALDGRIDAETARGLFTAWAERQNILASDFAAFVVSRRAGSHGTA
jgi:hypothetical protein